MTTRIPPGRAPRAHPVEGADAEDLVAVDDLPVPVDDDEAVGVAVEREAEVRAAATTSAASEAGAVAPQPRLMFTPSGSLWMTSTRAPVAARISGAVAPPAPFAQSRTMCRSHGVARARRSRSAGSGR